ncbi:hypothetical protein Pmani_009666 [Petrolisthes manimaculis]|uniref:Short coiled-coil protein n=1 Tax=Petrolisthes manimaculis TaxID=1843537 RepID=A0AAE1UDE5_9EUCA|nr:hypothetical protein Pmani_009666 [Petrolisthes manimaculis]
MKVSRSKTEYLAVNVREGGGAVRLQGVEVAKVDEFKYLGSTVQSNGECGRERRDGEYVGRRMLEMDPPGRRKRGRPKRRFMDAVKEDIRMVGVTEEDVEDRARWRQSRLDLSEHKSFTLVQLLINYFTLASAHSGAVEARTSVMSSYQDDNSIPLVDDDPSVVVDDDRTAASEISADSTRGQSLESIPSAYTNGSNSPLHNSLEPDMSPDEQEEKARLIAQVLELQNTLDDLSQRVDSVKEENLKLRSENQVLGQYIENLMSASSVFQSTSPKTKKKGT